MALIEKFSPNPTLETLVLDVGEDIMENTLQTTEIKRANDAEEKWELHCVPFLYKEVDREKYILFDDFST